MSVNFQYIGMNAIPRRLDMNISQQNKYFCSKLGLEVDDAKFNPKTWITIMLNTDTVTVPLLMCRCVRKSLGDCTWGWKKPLSPSKQSMMSSIKFCSRPPKVELRLMPYSHLACDGFMEPVSCPYPPFLVASAEAGGGCKIFIRIHRLRGLYDFL